MSLVWHRQSCVGDKTFLIFVIGCRMADMSEKPEKTLEEVLREDRRFPPEA